MYDTLATLMFIGKNAYCMASITSMAPVMARDIYYLYLYLNGNPFWVMVF